MFEKFLKDFDEKFYKEQLELTQELEKLALENSSSDDEASTD